jgi:uncharacterized membrane-anchored protein YhcB (DUF1043 family)
LFLILFPILNLPKKSELEKKLDEVLANQQLQNHFNQVLIQKLQEITDELVTTKEHLANTETKLIEVEQKNNKLYKLN